jgi:transaldolase
MIPSRIQETLDLGQSIWLDNIQRKEILSGELNRLISELGIRGETSNPAIFEKAISSSTDYQQEMQSLQREGKTTQEIYDVMTVEDVTMATRVFRGVFDSSQGVDGLVSLEVSPNLAYNTAGTIADARRIFKQVGNPNVMIKIPGTAPCIQAIEECLYEGIPVNITLLFSSAAYEAVAWAYVHAMERRLDEKKPIDCIPSVASFFISRVDGLADVMLDERITQASGSQADHLSRLKGQLGIANARLAYQKYLKIFGSPRFQRLAQYGARVQRPLWASTSTKNPAYPDVLYMDALIGANTVNTAPLETILAFSDHGTAANTLSDEHQQESMRVIAEFEGTGIRLDEISSKVLQEGVFKFQEAFGKLLGFIDKVSLAV